MGTGQLNAIPSSDEEGDRDSARTISYISEHETQDDNSDYNRFRKRQMKQLSKILAKELIARANKRAIQLTTVLERQVEVDRERNQLNA